MRTRPTSLNLSNNTVYDIESRFESPNNNSPPTGGAGLGGRRALSGWGSLSRARPGFPLGPRCSYVSYRGWATSQQTQHLGPCRAHRYPWVDNPPSLDSLRKFFSFVAHIGQRAMSLGFLTESALLPSKAKPIEVDGKSMVGLNPCILLSKLDGLLNPSIL